MEIMDTMDSIFLNLCTVWTQWTEKYAVDTSAVEWGARGWRFESSRPDQIESHESEVLCLNPKNVDK